MKKKTGKSGRRENGESSGQLKEPSPSYESERKDKEQQAGGEQDSSASRGSGLHSDVDEEEGEKTRLNQTEIQEGPKGGKPEEERRRSA